MKFIIPILLSPPRPVRGFWLRSRTHAVLPLWNRSWVLLADAASGRRHSQRKRRMSCDGLGIETAREVSGLF